jgi:hypothetical protein
MAGTSTNIRIGDSFGPQDILAVRRRSFSHTINMSISRVTANTTKADTPDRLPKAETLYRRGTDLTLSA